MPSLASREDCACSFSMGVSEKGVFGRPTRPLRKGTVSSDVLALQIILPLDGLRSCSDPTSPRLRRPRLRSDGIAHEGRVVDDASKSSGVERINDVVPSAFLVFTGAAREHYGCDEESK